MFKRSKTTSLNRCFLFSKRFEDVRATCNKVSFLKSVSLTVTFKQASFHEFYLQCLIKIYKMEESDDDSNIVS